ncbi:MAG: hypothetical protein CML68_20220 [Rhodobacteraceae bacterium]|nr:hypothetical protein [Paracoccaceae bacterium]
MDGPPKAPALGQDPAPSRDMLSGAVGIGAPGPEGDGGPRIRATTLSAPQTGGGLGAVGGEATGGGYSGAAEYTLPLDLPDIRGSRPDLALAYSSGGGNGLFGQGFALALGSITRRTALGVPQYDDSDGFVHGAYGLLVPVPGARLEPASDPEWRVQAYRPRAEGAFVRIERWTRLDDGTGHWLERTNENATVLFGSTREARVADPDDPARIFEWKIESLVDATGNRTHYVYDSHGPEDANRYPVSIRWGNYVESGSERWAMDLRFDYGGEERPDPFTSCRAGFALRTLRRCAALRLYRRFPALNGGAETLTRDWLFDYRPAEAGQGRHCGLSLLEAVTERGHRTDDQATQSQSLPPVRFDYSGYAPQAKGFEEVFLDPGARFLGDLAQGDYLPVDLDGQGVPGILYSDATTTLYWRNIGDGRFSGPVVPPTVPIARDLRTPGLSITSLSGDGQPALVQAVPAMAGAWTLDRGGTAEPFRRFEGVPTELGSGVAEWIDLDGSGLADLAVLTRRGTVVCRSEGSEGFAAPRLAAAPPDLPLARSGGAAEILTYADVLGDGLSHRVRIRPGEVTFWPCLGHGRFGAARRIAGAPTFGSRLDARAVFLADLDGTGTADLFQMGDAELTIWFNQGGERFSEPLTLTLPVPFTQLCRVRVADIKGTGTASLLLTVLGPRPRHFLLDLAGGCRPWMLRTVDTGAGRTLEFDYTTSAAEALRDRAEGRPWVTRLYRSMAVVAQVRSIDVIAGCLTTARYRYRDGTFSGMDREFEGFARVDSWDSLELADHVAVCSGAGLTPPEPDDFVPPVLTRTWYHTGSPQESRALDAARAAEFWQGDADAPSPPAVEPDHPIEDGDGPLQQQAWRVLAGHPIRREIYQRDGTPQEDIPLTVEDMTTALRLEQGVGPGGLAVVFAYTAGGVKATYERRADDPRIDQTAVLEVDRWGGVRRSITVSYGRRDGKARTVAPEQAAPRILLQVSTSIDHPETAAEPWRLIGLSDQERAYRLHGLASTGRYFSRAELLVQSAKALADTIPYGTAPTPGTRQAELRSWARCHYWNEGLSGTEPGRSGPQALVHHVAQAAFPVHLVEFAFGTRVDDILLSDDGGFEKANGYWWRRGLIQHYAEASEAHFLPIRTDGAFEGVDPAGALNPTTEVAYDPQWIVPVAVRQVLDGSTALVTRADWDWQALQIARLTDVNDNETETAFSPLGLATRQTLYGTENGAPAGDEPLSRSTPVPGPDFDEVLADPARFVERISRFELFDTQAWAAHGQPLRAIYVTRQRFLRGGEAAGKGPISVEIRHFDGTGQEVDLRIETEPETVAGSREMAAPRRFIVSGLVRRNNKGMVLESWRPYFADTAAYSPVPEPGAPQPRRFRYDGLGRMIEFVTPKGFLERVAYAPWEVTRWDRNDTIRDAPFFKSFPKTPKTPEDECEKTALEQTLPFFDTPERAVLDPLGATVRLRRDLLGAVTAETLEEIAAAHGTTGAKLMTRLLDLGYLQPEGATVRSARVAPWADAYLPDFRARARSALGAALGDAVLSLFRNAGLTTLTLRDVEGREMRVCDPRLLWAEVTGAGKAANFEYLWPMDGEPLGTDSADAGPARSLADAFDRPMLGWTARGHRIATRYDRLGRATETRVRDPDARKDRLAQLLVYGEGASGGAGRNLNGMVIRHYDGAGLVVTSSYALTGEALIEARHVRADFDRLPNWTQAARKAVAEEAAYVTGYARDAAGRIVFETTPDGCETETLRDRADHPVKLRLKRPGKAAEDVISATDYTAYGAMRALDFANGTRTRITHEVTTELIQRIDTMGPGTKTETETLQSLNFTYDPQGNVVIKSDTSWETVFCYNQKVSPISSYRYDALYRLRAADGRQGPGAQADGRSGVIGFCPPNIADRAKLERFEETYSYDDGGNLIRLRHTSRQGWTQEHKIAAGSNRLADGSYDPDGNMTATEGVSSLAWDEGNRLIRAHIVTRNGDADDAEFYLYDAAGSRVLRANRRTLSGGATETEVTVCVGGYELRRTLRNGKEKGDVRHTLTLQMAGRNVALMRSWSGASAAAPTWRYQMVDPQQSVSQETDAAGRRITYQEFLPFGGSAFLAEDAAGEAKDKRDRYMGKERDGATGFYYYGQRYYPPWLGRWLSCDPAGTVDRINLYEFADNNPVTLFDPTGMNPDDEAELFQSVRYMMVKELDESTQIANEIFNEAYNKKSLFLDETAEFSSQLQEKILEIFDRFVGALSAANETLATALRNAGSKDQGMPSDQRNAYKTMRTKFNRTVEKEFPNIDFSSHEGPRPFELHHLIYKKLRPNLAVTTDNFAMATRGSSRSGFIGTHEGLFHLISSGNDRSIYTREIAGVVGLMKRSFARTHGINLDATPNPTGQFAWLKLEDGATGYSIPAGTPTTGRRAPSLRVLKANAMKREAKSGSSTAYWKWKRTPQQRLKKRPVRHKPAKKYRFRPR